jgi:hypothetical protein
VKSSLLLPVLELLPDGSYRSVLVSPKITGTRREALIEAAWRGDDLDEDQARRVRVVEYEIPDREGDGKDELIALVTTVRDYRQASAAVLAQAYHLPLHSRPEPGPPDGHRLRPSLPLRQGSWPAWLTIAT